MAKSDSEWNKRVLCSDGNCIGIIGADGRCRECGTPYDGEVPSPAVETHTDDDGVDSIPADQQMTVEDAPADDYAAVGSEGSDESWENRTLCTDESCIGVIGPDGRCKECGKPYPG
ncbi:hypothetical protein [Desulfosarcina sp.]|nr:hypothetical protein [Desulfosarcina sp.]MDX2452806.1 hypothetical protein [Desulfosarcina sp.]MDX2490553.1 hypothetical protein [Desulfosarcina sp.]